MMAQKSYFRHGLLEVTNEFVKARGRSIQITTLESVDLGRRLFLGALALCGGSILFGILFGDLLYIHEIAIMVLLGGAALWVSWNVGTFTIYSKLTGPKGWTVTGWMKPLREMREAVELAIEERPARRSGLAASRDEDDAAD